MLILKSLFTCLAHRCVLAAASKYFEGMFQGNFKENGSSDVTLKDVSFEALSKCIEFVYSGELNTQTGTIADLVRTADYLDLPSVFDGISHSVVKEVNADNCTKYLSVCDRLTPEARQKVHQVIFDNLSEVANKAPFLEFSDENLTEILQCRPENCICPLYPCIMLEAISKWLKHNLSQRSATATDLFGTVIYREKLPVI